MYITYVAAPPLVSTSHGHTLSPYSAYHHTLPRGQLVVLLLHSLSICSFESSITAFLPSTSSERPANSCYHPHTPSPIFHSHMHVCSLCLYVLFCITHRHHPGQLSHPAIQALGNLRLLILEVVWPGWVVYTLLLLLEEVAQMHRDWARKRKPACSREVREGEAGKELESSEP
jgi:hypothetical protein